LIAARWISLRQQQCAWPVCAPLPGLAEADLMHSAAAAATLCLVDDPGQHWPQPGVTLSTMARRRHRWPTATAISTANCGSATCPAIQQPRQRTPDG
jgi:hypothetical protein